VHEGGVDRDVVVADVVDIVEDMDKDRVIGRIDEVRLIHRFQVAFQLREEEGDTILVDGKDVEVLEQVGALPYIFLCIYGEHPVKGAALDVVYAVDVARECERVDTIVPLIAEMERES